ncbi:hypothetical protein M2444_004691 [Paenibacillus sp. PastF-3]|uniref:hypothetical protein n=1 Tax=Paenibacillus sp. PastF-3 TaxID=2940626 RepID=UPI001DE43B58|nr:hypothetical protein [Paenibacillus sp. PastF-3]MBY3621166.1 hypothetical protein [Acinetobacter sp. CUI P1]MDH6372862.1 hypothetical protein [Paenibacillus sp. PastF-3]
MTLFSQTIVYQDACSFLQQNNIEWVNMPFLKENINFSCMMQQFKSTTVELIQYGNLSYSKKDILQLSTETQGTLGEIKFIEGSIEGYYLTLIMDSGQVIEVKTFDETLLSKVIHWIENTAETVYVA